MIQQMKITIWKNDSERELIRLMPDGRTAFVAVAACTADELRDLAEAAALASDALDLIAETKSGAVT